MNLFNVTHGIEKPGQNKPKPRQANQNEIKAYLIWLADRRGIWLPHDADYQLAGVYSKSADGFVLDMPGYDQDQRVTMETLGDDGEVIATQTLPMEPKKGGVIWDREAVRKAHGPIAKPAKAKRGTKVAEQEPAPMAAIAAPEPAQDESAPVAAQDGPEVVESLHGPDLAPDELLRDAQELPAAPGPDLEAITARLDALEAALATLSAVSTGTPIDEPAQERVKRTPAHERAIRRAWAERAGRREAERCRDALRADCHEWESLQHRTWTESMGHKMKRRAAAQRARRMIAAVRARADLDRRALDITNATVARLKHEIANAPASDSARLVQERDQARTALAAMAARAERAEQTVNAMADRFEGLVSRVTKAEAALRLSQAA